MRRRPQAFAEVWLTGGSFRVAPGGTPGSSRPSCRRKARTWSWEGRGWQELSALANQECTATAPLKAPFWAAA